MNKNDVDGLLIEVDAGAPCGPNLEYDPVFVALELEVIGKPEVQYGDTISAAIPPDCKTVNRLATGLLERSRDLRPAATGSSAGCSRCTAAKRSAWPGAFSSAHSDSCRWRSSLPGW